MKRSVAAKPAEPGAGREDETLAMMAYRRLRRDIVTGAFAPGQPLRLEALRQRYGLSFSPLREALNRLQTERLVVAAALRGFSVAPLSTEEMWDATETRILIESQALHRAIARGDDQWEVRIVAAFHALDLQLRRVRSNAASDDDVWLLEARHRDFHHALIASCGSPRLLSLADQLHAETQRYRLPALAGGAPAAKRDIASEHLDIMEATLDRTPAEAVALLAAHYRRTAEDRAAALGAS